MSLNDVSKLDQFTVFNLEVTGEGPVRIHGELRETDKTCPNWRTQECREILLTFQGKSRSVVSNTLLEWSQKAKKHLAKFVKTLETWWDEVVNACIFPPEQRTG